jgi:hypothetical protein
MLHIIYFYVECYYAECYYAECYYVECHYAQCHYAECHCAESHHPVCRDAKFTWVNYRCNFITSAPGTQAHVGLLHVLIFAWPRLFTENTFPDLPTDLKPLDSHFPLPQHHPRANLCP